MRVGSLDVPSKSGSVPFLWDPLFLHGSDPIGHGVFGSKLTAELHQLTITRVVLVNLDLFDPVVSAKARDGTFQFMQRAPNCVFLMPTRHTRTLSRLYPEKGQQTENRPILPRNVWPGVCINSHEDVTQRVPFLLRVPALVRFALCEVALNQLNILKCLHHQGRTTGCRVCEPEAPSSCDQIDHPGLDWILALCSKDTSSSGWQEDLRRQCKIVGIPFTVGLAGETTLASDCLEVARTLNSTARRAQMKS